MKSAEYLQDILAISFSSTNSNVKSKILVWEILGINHFSPCGSRTYWRPLCLLNFFTVTFFLHAFFFFLSLVLSANFFTCKSWSKTINMLIQWPQKDPNSVWQTPKSSEVTISQEACSFQFSHTIPFDWLRIFLNKAWLLQKLPSFRGLTPLRILRLSESQSTDPNGLFHTPQEFIPYQPFASFNEWWRQNWYRHLNSFCSSL